MSKAASIARQVWQEFSPRDAEKLTCGDDGIIWVAVEGSGAEGFDIDPDQPAGSVARTLADRIQAILMEAPARARRGIRRRSRWQAARWPRPAS